MPYRIRFAESATDQFSRLTARQQTTLLQAVKIQLKFEPFRETRNRKQLRPNPLAPWELRVGMLRVFYEPDAEESNLINILAIGIKKGNRIIVADQEIYL